MKKVLLFLLVYFFSLSAQAEEIRFYCSSKTSNYNDLFVDLEKKIVFFDIGSMYIITSLTDQHLIAEYHLTKSNRLIFDRYTLILDWWDMYGDYHNFKCKLLKKQF